MNYFDSINIAIPLSIIEIDITKFYPRNESKTILDLKQEYYIEGVSRMQINMKDLTLKIDLSSKVLGKDCLKLIQTNTLTKVHLHLMKTGVFKCSYSTFLKSQLRKCDVTSNLSIERISEVIVALQAYGSKDYRVTKPHSSKGLKTGIEFHRTVNDRRSKMRVVLYDKSSEIRKDRLFLNTLNLSDQRRVLRQAKNLLRIEVNLTTFQKMREYFGVKENTLGNIVNSPKNVVFQVISKIVNASPSSKNLSSLNIDTLSKNEISIYWALQANDWNVEAIRATYRAKNETNLTRRMKPIEQMYAQRNNSNSSLVTELLDQLRQAG